MKAKRKTPELSPSEWYFSACPETEIPACCYYEYARFCPAIIDAVECLSNYDYNLVEQRPAPKYVAILARGFPGVPWLDLPKSERERLLRRFNTTKEAASLVFKLIERPGVYQWHPAFPTTGEYLLYNDWLKRTTVVFDVFWSRSNSELKAMFQKFLDKYRPAGTASTPGRVMNHLDFLHSIGARRLINLYAKQDKDSATIEAAAAMSKHAKSLGDKQPPYAEPGPLSRAASKTDNNLRKLYYIPTRKALKPGGQHAGTYFVPWAHVEKSLKTKKGGHQY